MNFETKIPQKSSDYQRFDESAPAPADRRNLSGLMRVALVTLAILAVGALIYYLMRPDPAKKVDAAPVPHVSVMHAGFTSVARVVTTTGTLAARREMPVSAVGDGGRVSRVLAEPGDWVRAGQVLVTIDRTVQAAQASASAAQISVAEANARIAQSELERAQTLVARGFISKADVDRKTATRDSARAQVSVARAQSGETVARNNRLDIRAPAAGLVLTRAVEPGQVVGPGTGVLFRIARGGEMELKAQLAEADLAKLSRGARAEVTPIGTQASFAGDVWQIAPVIDAQTRQGTARIALAYNHALRPGGFATAKLSLGAIDAPLLPQSAVLASDGGSYVFIVGANNKVAKRPVTIGDISDAGVAIAQGLDGTEQVIVSAGAFVNVGETVKPVLIARAK